MRGIVAKPLDEEALCAVLLGAGLQDLLHHELTLGLVLILVDKLVVHLPALHWAKKKNRPRVLSANTPLSQNNGGAFINPGQLTAPQSQMMRSPGLPESSNM